MSDRNWEAELAKIDKQLASVSDEALLAERTAAVPPRSAGRPSAASGALPSASSGRASAVATVPAAGSWKAWLKVAVAVGAAAGMMFWPWPAQCGPALVGFTAATGAVAVLGLWSAVSTWKHRLGLAHVASLLVVMWGLALGAREVLPRVGYAVPSDRRSAGWSCDGVALPAPPASVIGPTASAPTDGHLR
jgi:hypothetical protein